MDKVWNLYSEFRAKGLRPNADYLKSRLPEHFYDIVPFRNMTGVDEAFQKAMFHWMIRIKENMLEIMRVIFYGPEFGPNDDYYSLYTLKDSSGKEYYVVNLAADRANRVRLVDREAFVCFSYYEGAVLKQSGLTPQREYDNEIHILIPDSKITPEGLYKDSEIMKTAYRNVMDFLSDNGINLAKSRSYYGNLINDTIYKLEIVIPYRDLKKL
ncbi:MAG: hypothetical protein V3G42_14470 [Oscillospiraceae bacterium]